MLKDNLHRDQWDFDKLKNFDFQFLENMGYNLKELVDLTDADRDQAALSLQEKFIVPLFPY